LLSYVVKAESDVDLPEPVPLHEAALLPAIDRNRPARRIGRSQSRKETKSPKPGQTQKEKKMMMYSDVCTSSKEVSYTLLQRSITNNTFHDH
jgi:hypothetical protein